MKTVTPNRNSTQPFPETIDIEGAIGGSLSSEVGKLSNLKKFSLKNSLVKGSIPSELGRLSRLGTYQNLTRRSQHSNYSLPYVSRNTNNARKSLNDWNNASGDL
jgi:hypothetical protein